MENDVLLATWLGLGRLLDASLEIFESIPKYLKLDVGYDPAHVRVDYVMPNVGELI